MNGVTMAHAGEAGRAVGVVPPSRRRGGSGGSSPRASTGPQEVMTP
jgi:hypothetical protein